MIKFRFILSTVFSLFVSSVVFAEALTFETVCRQALAHDDRLMAQRERSGVSKAVLQGVQGSRLPQLNFLATEQFQDASSSGGSSSYFTTSHRPEYKLALKQSLFTGFRDSDTVTALEAQIRQQDALYFNIQHQVLASVVDSFFQGLLLEKEIKSVQEIKKLVLIRLDELQRRYNLGKSRKSELLSGEAYLTTLDAKLGQLQGDLARERLTISTLAHTDYTQASFEDPAILVEVPQFDVNFLKTWVNQKPEVRAAQAELSSEKAFLQLAGRMWWPTISLGADYFFKRADSLDAVKWDTTLTADFSLYQGGSDEASVVKSTHKVSSLEHDLDFLGQQLVLQLKQDWLRVDSQATQFRLAAQVVQKNQAYYQASLDDFKLGQINHLEVIQSLNSYLEAKQNMDIAYVEFLRAHYRFYLNRDS